MDRQGATMYEFEGMSEVDSMEEVEGTLGLNGELEVESSHE